MQIMILSIMISKLNDMMSICNTLEKVCKVSSFIISVINWEITTLKFYICKSFPIINEKNLPLSLSFQIMFSKVQSLSHVRLFVTPWTTAHQASLSITNSQSRPKPMFIESVMPSNHLILCRPLLLLSLIFPSIRVFSNESRI